MAEAQELLTTTEAAHYLGLARQTVASAAKKGEIGKPHPAPGTRDGWIYMFSREELDRWRAAPRHAGGRPKDGRLILTPVISL